MVLESLRPMERLLWRPLFSSLTPQSALRTWCLPKPSGHRPEGEARDSLLRFWLEVLIRQRWRGLLQECSRYSQVH